MNSIGAKLRKQFLNEDTFTVLDSPRPNRELFRLVQKSCSGNLQRLKSVLKQFSEKQGQYATAFKELPARRSSRKKERAFLVGDGLDDEQWAALGFKPSF
ncbi:hypothetical protein [Rufibacter roseolus]|uniref:hypothetical protein n=1 Tax=Rufibacter roseolus TaxID=2817375 RepID=UPI001B31421F|nr:hypothetical protein [Rufibacter roseolus]